MTYIHKSVYIIVAKFVSKKMTKTWINFKPKTTNEVWSSNTACVCRSRNSKKEKELKDALENLKFPDLYDSLLKN